MISTVDRERNEPAKLCNGDSSTLAARIFAPARDRHRGMSVDAALLRAFSAIKLSSPKRREISKETITVDLHCHPNALAGSHFPRLDPDVPAQHESRRS